MSEKIKKMAIKLEGLISKHENAQEVYNDLVKLMRKQKPFFNLLQPSEIIQLLFYIYSIKKRGDFTLGDFILGRLFFAGLFHTNYEKYTEECQHCDGGGSISCEECRGNETVECPDCDGNGEIEDSNEIVPCRECQGGGEVTCPECDGSGSETCHHCYGDGEMDTNDFQYELQLICSWNNELKDRCELTKSSFQSTISDDSYDRIRNSFVVLDLVYEHAEFRDELTPNTYYCTDFEESPTLSLNYGMAINFKTDIDFYIL
jgi:hypothetical protein